MADLVDRDESSEGEFLLGVCKTKKEEGQVDRDGRAVQKLAEAR